MRETRPIGVYIKVNAENNIIAVGSDIFITDFTNWIKIDEGEGDKYAHAQGNYFENPLISENGKHSYRYENGNVISNI